ncbi:MAG TPA: SpoIID/LytB domain-containing protein [Candidatus Methylomirabilis sp.]|nr:SpoIID/LytB domain-containing protein [Candidatus Methylomirabilis sp.]
MAIFPVIAHASGQYEGSVDKKTVTVELNPGETGWITLTYTNAGSNTWYRDARTQYVSLYLVGAATSPVGGRGWRTNDSPGRIRDASVKPGAKTVVTFPVFGNAPGTFTHTLRLASEDTAWMYGAQTSLTVKVRGAVAATPTASASSVPTPSAQAPASTQKSYSATLLLRSARELVMKGDAREQVTFGFKNTGTALWTSRSMKLSSVFPALTGSLSSVHDASWRSVAEPTRVDNLTNPGEIGFLSFTIKAPAKSGTYRVSFTLEADGKTVDGGAVDIPITVTSDGVIQTQPPITPTPTPTYTPPNGVVPITPDAGPEPTLRVGIFATTDDQMIVTAAGPFRVHQKGATNCSFTAGEELTVRFDRANKVYKLTGPRCVSQSTEVYHVQGIDDPLLPLEMTDFTRPVAWLPGANDNKFRGVLELRWSSVTDAVWVVNQLPIEQYLYGIAETSDVSPMEYQRALLTAARTYAYYHWKRATKHADEGFHVDAKYDQVYRGYGAEARSPKIVQAVKDTRGQIVVYGSALAITPYYSRSDGRTRNWTEVWGGSGFPWLVSVQVPQDAGKTLWGHGVGMSASGALGMANEGTNYQDILKHFYQGTGLVKFYQ